MAAPEQKKNPWYSYLFGPVTSKLTGVSNPAMEDKPAEYGQVSTLAPYQIDFQEKILPAAYEQAMQRPYSKVQEDYMKKALATGGAGLQKFLGSYKPFDFEPIKQQAIKQFRDETVPELAARLGATGGIHTGTFMGRIGLAESSLREKLAALEAQINLQREPQFLSLLQGLQNLGLTRMQPTGALGLAGLGMTTPFQPTYTPPEAAWWKQLIPYAGTALGYLAGGPAGAYLGGQLGQGAYSALAPGASAPGELIHENLLAKFR